MTCRLTTRFLLLAAVFAVLTACDSGSTTGTTGTTAATGTTPAAPAPSLTLALTDPLGATTTFVPATVRATVRDAAGAAVPNAVVTFSTNAALGTLNPVSGTALTDSAGVATVGLTASGLTAAGAGTITAISQVGSTAVSGSSG